MEAVVDVDGGFMAVAGAGCEEAVAIGGEEGAGGEVAVDGMEVHGEGSVGVFDANHGGVLPCIGMEEPGEDDGIGGEAGEGGAAGDFEEEVGGVGVDGGGAVVIDDVEAGEVVDFGIGGDWGGEGVVVGAGG